MDAGDFGGDFLWRLPPFVSFSIRHGIRVLLPNDRDYMPEERASQAIGPGMVPV
jgi:hypothetical protein